MTTSAQGLSPQHDRCRLRHAVANRLAAQAMALATLIDCTAARADPYVCVGAMPEVDVLFHVRQDAYFGHRPLVGRTLRIEPDGCGYRVYVTQRSAAGLRSADLLLVDRYGHVTRIVHSR